jgi:hypothetical protein
MGDRYAGIAGMTVAVVDGAIVLDVSTPERPQHTRLRLSRDGAVTLGWELIDAADRLPS